MHIKILAMLMVLGLLAYACLRAYGSPRETIEELSRPENKNVRRGILAFLVVLVGAGLAIPVKADVKGEFFAYSEVYAGIDYTLDQSPFCRDGLYDDKATSNGGFRQNLWRSDNRYLHINFKYTHHSCAFNHDRPTYDAFGFEIKFQTDNFLLFFPK